MDSNNLLLWTAGLSSLVTLATVARTPREGTRGWLVSSALVLALIALAYLALPAQAGYIGGTAWALLLLIPARGNVRLARLTGTLRYEDARRLSIVLGFLHPFDGWLQRPALMHALFLAQKGEVTAALEILERIAATAPPSLRRQAIFHRFRIKGEWRPLRAWIEAGSNPADLGRDPVLLANYLRALGEAGDPNQLLSTLARHLPALESATVSPQRVQAYLWAFAFGGRRDASARVLRRFLGFGPEMHDFWIATAEAAAGQASARSCFERLSRHSDAMIRSAAQERLQYPLSDATSVLTPDSFAILANLEHRLTLEERYAQQAFGAGPRPRATWWLAGLLAAMFVVEVLAGGSEDSSTLYRLGALVTWQLDLGQSWRLVAFTLLHAGPLHFLMNTLGLIIMGPYLERALGTRRYLLVYWSSGILGGLLVVALAQMLSRPTVLVGASGCIMGLIGGTGAVLLRGWRQEHARPASRRLAGVVLIFVVQVAFDLATPEVSFTAHAAGMVIGFLVTSRLRHWRPEAARGG